MLGALVQKALVQWRGEGVNLLPPLHKQDVISTLSLTGRHISKDVIELYCITGGMIGKETDRYLWSLWPLETVVEENANYTKHYLLFADFLIHSHLYCFEYRSEEVSAVCIEWGDLNNVPHRLADSVEEFFDLYLKRPENVELYIF